MSTNQQLREIMDATLKNRASRMADRLVTDADSFTKFLYGDRIPWSERSMSYKIGWHVTLWRDRIRDAWNVLIGRDHVGGDH